jgi:hypothetical protein
MMAAAAIVLSMVIVPLSGGSLGRLTALELHGSWRLLFLFFVQSWIRGPRFNEGAASGLTVVIWGLATLCLMVILWSSHTMPGIPLVILGLACNQTVVLANSAMPYAFGVASSEGGMYRLSGLGTQLAWMADVLPDPSKSMLFSLGDVLLMLGIVVLMVFASLPLDRLGPLEPARHYGYAHRAQRMPLIRTRKDGGRM